MCLPSLTLVFAWIWWDHFKHIVLSCTFWPIFALSVKKKCTFSISVSAAEIHQRAPRKSECSDTGEKYWSGFHYHTRTCSRSPGFVTCCYDTTEWFAESWKGLPRRKHAHNKWTSITLFENVIVKCVESCTWVPLGLFQIRFGHICAQTAHWNRFPLCFIFALYLFLA